jgi:hypothetical protein
MAKWIILLERRWIAKWIIWLRRKMDVKVDNLAKKGDGWQSG